MVTINFPTRDVIPAIQQITPPRRIRLTLPQDSRRRAKLATPQAGGRGHHSITRGFPLHTVTQTECVHPAIQILRTTPSFNAPIATHNLRRIRIIPAWGVMCGTVLIAIPATRMDEATDSQPSPWRRFSYISIPQLTEALLLLRTSVI